MNGEVNDADLDFIESSQVPILRENVRRNRIFYGEASNKGCVYSDSKSRKKTRSKLQSKATVSQCMQQEWKSPRVTKRVNLGTVGRNNLPSVSPEMEGFVKIVTQQQEAENRLGYNPSVNLFDLQEEVIQRYMFNERSEAQQEEMLDEILEGFRASYEEANARLNGSRVLAASPAVEATAISSNVTERVAPVWNVEPEPVDRRILEKEPRQAEHWQEAMIANDISPTVMVDGCLDLSKKGSTSHSEYVGARDDLKKYSQREWHNRAKERNSSNHDEVLDLHIAPPTQVQRTGRPREYVSQFCQRQQGEHKARKTVGTKEDGTQTERRTVTRNAGIQHRPVASFDMTRFNVITLARMVGSNPDSLYVKLREITRTSPQELWHSRNLSHVFTAEDPYYAKLGNFMSTRL